MSIRKFRPVIIAATLGVLALISDVGTSVSGADPNIQRVRLSLSGPVGVAVDRAGHMYVTDNQHNRVLKLSRGGRLLAQWPLHLLDSSGGSVGSPMATDSRGNIYIVNGDTNQLLKFSPYGHLLKRWEGTAVWLHSCGYIRGIALDTRDNVYVSSQDNVINGCGGYVVKVSPEGRLLARWHTGASALSIAVDSHGTMFVPYQGKRLPAECCGGSGQARYSLLELSPAGTVRARISLGTFTVGSSINLAVDGAGGLWLTNTGANAISRRLPNGHWAFNHTRDADCISTLCDPQGIAITRAGAAVVADTLNNRIVVFSATGKVAAIWR